MDRQNEVHAYGAILLFHFIKGGSPDTRYTVHEPRPPYAKGNSPATKGEILYPSHSFAVSGGVRFIDTGRVMAGAGGWGRGMGRQCSMGTEFQCGKVETFCRWMVAMVTKPRECTRCQYTGRLETVKMVKFTFSVFCHNKKVKTEEWRLRVPDL